MTRDDGIRHEEIEVQGEPVRVLRAGAGPTVVLVHGLGLGAAFWRAHMERLAAHCCAAIAPDVPGFGRSTGPAFGFTVEHAAEWLAAFADATGVRDAVWVGHSVSAQYVLRLGVARPDLVRALLLAAPTGEPGRMRWLAQMIGLARTSVRERPRLVARILGHYFTTPPTRVLGAWLGARRHHPLEDAPRFHGPLRVVLGGRDPVVPPEFAEQLVALAPQGELTVLADSAHGVALAPAAPFIEVLLDFVDRVFPRGAVEDAASARGKAVETR